MKKVILQMAEPSFSDWEDLLTSLVAEKLELCRSDAQGYIEVNDFYISQAWAKAMDPESAANYIINKNSIIN